MLAFGYTYIEGEPMESSAFTVVCLDSDPQWQEERRKLVTGTIAPQLLGVHRYGSLLSSYLRMRGAPSDDDVDAVNNREILDWGTDQQDSIIRNLKRRLGLDARPFKALLRSTLHPWAGCTIDGLVQVDDERLPFEVKTTRSPPVAELWKDCVPDFVDAQVQHQMLITGAPRSLVAASLFGAPPIFQWVERNEERIDALVAAGREFWARVERGDPPDPDGSDDDDRAVDVSRESGKVVELDIEAVTLTERIAELSAEIGFLTREKKEAQQKIRLMMGDAERGNLPGDGLGGWKVIERRTAASRVVENRGDFASSIAERLDAAGARVRRFVLEAAQEDDPGIMAIAKALEGCDVRVEDAPEKTSSHIRKVK